MLARTCGCSVTAPLFDNDGQESGLCKCGGIYDDRLYEMNLRKHWPGLPENADLEECLAWIRTQIPDHPWAQQPQT